MTNNNTKKSLKASGLALFVCIAMLIGTTFAWFTDSITNSGNKIESGSLDITFEEWDGTKYVDVSKTPIFNYTKWEPGYTDIVAVKIANNGSLALKYQVDFISKDMTAYSENLLKTIEVYYKDDANAERGMPTDLTGFAKLGTLADFLDNKDNIATGKLKANGNADYAMIALHMPESAGNDVQSLSTGTFDIVVHATQLNSETDGFGNADYDEDAKYDIVKVASAEELFDAVAIAKGKTIIKVNRDITISDDRDLVIDEGADITLELNSKTISIERKGMKPITVSSGGCLNISNGKIETSTASYDIQNSGVLNLHGVELLNSKNNGSGIHNYGELTVVRSNIKVANRAINNYNATVKSISDSNIISVNQDAIYNSGTVTIDNIINSNIKAINKGSLTYYALQNSDNTVIKSIEKSNFYGAIGSKGTIQIKSGSFEKSGLNINVFEKMISEGSQVLEESGIIKIIE